MPVAEADVLRDLVRAAEKAKPSGRKAALTAAAEGWETTGMLQVAAEYHRLAADMEPQSASAFGEAGDRFYALIPSAGDDQEQVDYVFRAMYGYERALELDSQDLERKIRLATLYTDHQGNVMQGVLLLREVAAADSNNTDAQLRLGRFSLMSGQTDKALARFRTVIRQDSLNLPARILLAQTLANAGDPDAAEGVLRDGLAIAPDSTARTEIGRMLDDLAGVRQ